MRFFLVVLFCACVVSCAQVEVNRLDGFEELPVSFRCDMGILRVSISMRCRDEFLGGR